MQNKLFKKSSVERFSSPEKLDDYIQVSTPASWMVLGAALALLLGLLIWGFFGEMTQTASFSGIVRDGLLRCYISGADVGELSEGMQAEITPLSGGAQGGVLQGSVASIAAHPLSYTEASAGIESDYLLDALGITTWNIPVIISTQQALYEDVVYNVRVVTKTFRPIDLVFQ